MSPGHGANVFGSSALIRHSIAWPRKLHGPRVGEVDLLSRGRADLELHEVEPRHHLGHGVLDLHARVHLEEVDVLRLVHQKLERAERRVARLADRLADDLAHLLPPLGRHGGARRLLHDLLVAALERALALAERPDPAVVVGEDLELDVPRALDELLEVDVGVLEARLGFPRGAPEGVGDLGLRAGRCASRARRRRPTP